MINRFAANGDLRPNGVASQNDRFLRYKKELHQQIITNMDLSSIGTMEDEDLRA
jgi:hypothetical protein